MTNDLVGLNIDGTWCDDPLIVKSQVKNYFEKRFALQTGLKISIDGVEFKSLSRKDNDVLCKDITEQDIVDADWQYGSTKSAGLEGYNFHFFKK